MGGQGRAQGGRRAVQGPGSPWAPPGYTDPMSQPTDQPNDRTGDQTGRPEVGLIRDEDLPEDLQPTDDNPLAQDPERSDTDDGASVQPEKVDGMPDLADGTIS